MKKLISFWLKNMKITIRGNSCEFKKVLTVSDEIFAALSWGKPNRPVEIAGKQIVLSFFSSAIFKLFL
jgi:hypothetical protein